MIKKSGPIEFKENIGSLESQATYPSRNQSCKNYETCLNLAASLDCEGFDCTNCNKKINEQLIWRAQSAQREDNLSKKIFPIPKIKSIVTKKEIVVKKVS